MNVLAFDTGPGNMIVDGAVQRLTEGRRAYDEGGRIALKGCPSKELVERLLKDAYLRRSPPKSTGRERYGESYVVRTEAWAKDLGLSGPDWVASLTRFVAVSVRDGLERFAPAVLAGGGKILLCGGGAANDGLRTFLAEEFPEMAVAPLCQGGVTADNKEAFSFAVLGDAALRGEPNNAPSATGATRSVVMGKWALP